MRMPRFVAALALLACAGMAQACELVADFDRGRIPGEDAGTSDASAHATADEDAGDEDAGTSDAGASATAGDDAGTDDGGA